MQPFEFAKIENWVREAGNIALSYYQTNLVRKQKTDSSPVTEADKAVEDFILGKLKRAYAAYGHGFVAEESGEEQLDREFVWTVDPIDGTRVFADGLPLWAITIGLLHNGEPYRGVVYLPVVNEIYYTNDDGVPFWNGRPLAGMLPTEWHQDSFIGVSSGAHRQFDIDFKRIRALGAVAMHYVFVARGVSVAVLHGQVKVWDITAAYAILSGVGGIAMTLDGRQLSFQEILTESEKKTPILVGHPQVVERLRSRIKVR